MKDNFDLVRQLGLALPGVEEGTMYRTPALKVGGKLLACIASHKSAEPGSLVVRISFERRAELLETDPEVYYLKDHYVGYPCVLARLDRIHPDALRGLLDMGWKFVTSSQKRRSVSPRATPASDPRARRGSKGTATPGLKPRARSLPRSPASRDR